MSNIYKFVPKRMLLGVFAFFALNSSLSAQTAMPNCEGIFRMFRFDGLELFDGDTVCIGTEVTFLDESTSPDFPMSNWEWQFDDDNLDAFIANPTYTYTEENTWDIQLSVDNGNNCFTSVEHTLTIISPPNYSYTATPATCSDNCTGTASIFNLTGLTINYYAQWSDGQSGFDAFSLCPGNYTATVTDDYGCVGIAAAGDEAVVTAPPVLVADVTTINPLYLCPTEGAVISLDINGGTSASGNYQASWSPQDGLDNPFGTSTFFTADASNLNQTYTATVTDDNGCEATASIDILATPSNVSGNVSIGGAPCEDCEVVLYNFNPLPGPWPIGATDQTNSSGGYNLGDIPAFTDFVVMVRPNDVTYPGAISTYYLDGSLFTHNWDDATSGLLLNTGCGQSLNTDVSIIEPVPMDGSCTITGGVYRIIPGKMQEEDPIPLIDVVVEKVPPGNSIISTVTDNPTGQYEFIGLPQLQDGELYEFYVNIPGVPGLFDYQIGVAGPDLVFDHIDFCLNLDSTAIVACTVLGLTDPANVEASGLLVYPNPTNGQFSISMGAMKGETATIEVLDMAGRKVWERNMGTLPDLMLVSGISAGSYVVQVSSATEVRSARLSITE
jgi:PKD repeat protein